MQKKKTITLGTLRDSITDRQREILDDVWTQLKKTNIGAPERPLFDKYGKSQLLHETQKLGRSVIYSNHEENKIRYNLGLVGIFLTSDGPHLEKVVEKYLIVLRDVYAKDKEIERFSSKDLASWAPELSANELASLRQILYRSQGSFASRLGGWNTEEWLVSVDDDVVELKNVKNWKIYIQAGIMKQHDSRLPADRIRYHGFSAPSPTWGTQNGLDVPKRLQSTSKNYNKSQRRKLDLTFIKDDVPLLSIVDADWKEACQALTGKAWKSCVLLCAGIVEGLLLWQLERAQRDINAAQGKTIDIRYDGEVLSIVIRMSREQGLLGEHELFLTEWARIFRNTIHPGNQRRTGRTPTKMDADLALKVVQVIAEGVRSRARNTAC